MSHCILLTSKLYDHYVSVAFVKFVDSYSHSSLANAAN